MGMLNDYKVQEENRQKVADETYAFYQTVDLPGTRTFDFDINLVRQHVKEMEEVKALPNHD
jgi:hypothetical protein